MKATENEFAVIDSMMDRKDHLNGSVMMNIDSGKTEETKKPRRSKARMGIFDLLHYTFSSIYSFVHLSISPGRVYPTAIDESVVVEEGPKHDGTCYNTVVGDQLRDYKTPNETK